MIRNMTSEAFSNLRLFTCNSHPELAQEIAEHMGVELGKSTVTKFSDGEISVSIWESVRGKDCFIIQSTCEPVNDNIMELLIMTDALKRASCNSVTAVIPYYGYARQDRKAKARDPITSKLVANMITAAGIDRVITMDLHASQEQGQGYGEIDIGIVSPQRLRQLCRIRHGRAYDDALEACGRVEIGLVGGLRQALEIEAITVAQCLPDFCPPKMIAQ